jgi:hypothetical protein
MIDEKKKSFHPIRCYERESDTTEWGRTLTSVLQLEERTEHLRESYSEFQISVAQRKIHALQDQQTEVSKLLLALPPIAFTSALPGLVRNETQGVTGGTFEALVEFLVSDRVDINFLECVDPLLSVLLYAALFIVELSKQYPSSLLPPSLLSLLFVLLNSLCTFNRGEYSIQQK